MFTLISLPYASLEPVISDQLEEIIRSAKGRVFNNAGQILNHELYFMQFKPCVADAPCQPEPCGASPLRKQIVKQGGPLSASQAPWGQRDPPFSLGGGCAGRQGRRPS